MRDVIVASARGEAAPMRRCFVVNPAAGPFGNSCSVDAFRHMADLAFA
jgi:hypothetical protein